MSNRSANPASSTPTAEPGRVESEQSADTQEEERQPMGRTLLRLLRPAIVLTLLLTALVGIIYPLATFGVAQGLFPSQANGSIVYVNGHPIGSSLIGQYWTQPQYFHGRPSATNNLQGTPAPYQANNSGASNLGPTNPTLISTVQQRVAALKKENPDVAPGTPIPVDLVTASGSGLDPDISVAAAYYQIPRVAKARGMTQETVRNIVDEHVTGRFMGLFGEPRVNVLEVNLALDGTAGH